jgi:bifunctional non-homologous end joining protein LigD
VDVLMAYLGWAFEFKWDGVRVIAAATGDQVRLHSRNGNGITGGYPELAPAKLAYIHA